MRAFLVILFAFFAAPAAAEDAWQVVKPGGLGFEVAFPKMPSANDETVDLEGGKVAHVRSFQIMAENAIFDVTIADYPKGSVQTIGEEQALDNARDGAVGSAPGPLLSESRIELAGRPAREILVDMSMGMVTRSRLFIVGDRLYNVGAVTRKDETKAERIEKFFASFKLTDGPGAPAK